METKQREVVDQGTGKQKSSKSREDLYPQDEARSVGFLRRPGRRVIQRHNTQSLERNI